MEKPKTKDTKSSDEETNHTPVSSSDQKPANKPAAEKSDNLITDLYYGFAEKTFAESPFVPASQRRPYNPDDLFQMRGDYAIYEDMIQDDQINICLQIKKDLILASGWDIVVEDSDEEDSDVKEFLEIALAEKTEYPFDDMLEEILSAYDFGFSLTEKIFQKSDDGMLNLKCLKTRHPASWLIHTDEKGAITRYEQRGHKESVDIEPKSLIHYINQPRFQTPYGRSDLRAAYNAWFVKRQVIKYYGIFLEKASSPVPIAKYNKSAPQQAVNDIYNAIKSFQAKTALAIPADIEVDFLETKNSGDAFEKAINIFNMFIGRALFIPDLLGFQGSETGGGSYSLGQDQINVFFKHIQRRRETLERMVNLHIVRPIVLYNFGDMESFPKWKLRPIKDDDAAELAKLWLEAMKGKLYKPSEEEINHFRSLAKFPEGAVEFVEESQVDPTTGLPMPKNGMPGTPGNEGGKDGKEEKPGAAPEDQKAAKQDPEKAPKKFALEQSPYEKKVDFAAIETSMDRFKDRVCAQAKPLLKKLYADLGEQIKKKRIIQAQRPDKLDALKVRFSSDLKKALKGNLREAHQDAKIMAQNELLKGNYKLPIEDEAFLEFLDAEIDSFIKDFEAGVLKKTKTEIIAAIKDGRPLSSVLGYFDEYGLEASLEQVERLARTKFTEVMNRGRVEFFNDSGVVAAYQYSAILDDRTSEICAGLHGKIFAANDAPIPPMHFNCRSILVPITKYEDWKADTRVGSKPIDKFIDDTMGEGFSKFSLKSEPKQVEDDRPEIGDDGVDFSHSVDGTTDTILYSKDGKPFKRVTVQYDDSRKRVVSRKTEQL